VLATIPACSGEGATGVSPEPHAYAVPEAIDDGWTTGHAADEGISVNVLEEMVDRVRRGSYVNIHGVLLVRNGKLVLEEYFDGRTVSGRPKTYGRGTRHEQHSVTKSVTSLLAGIALDQGLIELDTPLHTFFPDHPAFEDERKQLILLRHVLSMTAGLAWDEWTYWYTDSRNDHVRMNRSGDPINFVLNLPAVNEGNGLHLQQRAADPVRRDPATSCRCLGTRIRRRAPLRSPRLRSLELVEVRRRNGPAGRWALHHSARHGQARAARSRRWPLAGRAGYK
jgi:hypothetical protein